MAKPAAFIAAFAAPLAIAAVGYAQTGAGDRPFYVPSQSMAPTLIKGDRFLARMGRPASFRRGDIVLVDAPRGGIYVVRVVGLPGDQIEMVDGIVMLNSQPVAQRFLRSDRVESSPYGSQARRLAEQFPGEATPHEIYDAGHSSGDDMARQVVAPGRLFLLGDNRDHSADSRFSAEHLGLEQVPVEHVRGVPDLFYWSNERSRIGQRVR